MPITIKMSNKQQTSIRVQTQYSATDQSKKDIMRYKLDKIIKKYDRSNYFHVGPRRELIQIAVKLVDEFEQKQNERRKIARLESEINIMKNQLENSEERLNETQNELVQMSNICKTLTQELEDNVKSLDDIRHIVNKKRTYSSI
jgi:hypothetical protein